MAFATEKIIPECKLSNLRKKSVWENGEKTNKTVDIVDILVWGDKPISVELLPDQLPSLKLNVIGACRLLVRTEMIARPYRRDDGREDVSYILVDKQPIFKQFGELPVK